MNWVRLISRGCRKAGSFSCVALLLFTLTTHAQYTLNWESVDSGGGAGTGGVYQVDTTLGQPDAARRKLGGSYSLAGGFRAEKRLVEPVRIPQGLVAWWRAEENTLDTIGGHHGSISNGVAYTNGIAGSAFHYTGSANQHVRALAAAALDVGAGGGLTVEAWIRPRTLSSQIIVEWNTSAGTPIGAHLSHSSTGGGQGGPGAVYANLLGADGTNRIFTSATNLVSTNVFQHVGVTYDRASGIARLFLNGVVVKETNFGSFTPRTTGNVYLGNRPGSVTFNGALDEPSIYNRALTPGEMAALHAADAAGKSTEHPHFLTGPELPLAPAYVGYTQTLATVLGVAPVTFQLDTGALPPGLALSGGGTISGVPTAAGDYAFTIKATDAMSLSVTQVFTLRVIQPLLPDGLVSWWRAEGNGLDWFGTNHAVLTGDVGYTAGKFGQGFNLNGVITNRIRVPASASLNVGAGNGFTLEAWIRPNLIASGFHVFEWNSGGANGWGVHLTGTFGAAGQMGLYANVEDTDGTAHTFSSPSNLLSTNFLQHVALTYDRPSGEARLWLNGAVIGFLDFGSFAVRTTDNFYIGHRPVGSVGSNTFNGVIDEAALYNRALTTNELRLLAQNSPAFKAIAGPTFLTASNLPFAIQRANYAQILTAHSGATPVTHAVAGGALPAGLTLTPTGVLQGTSTVSGVFTFTVQATDNAALTAVRDFTLEVQDRLTPPPGIVAWWRAESNALDSIGTNHGTLFNGATYTNPAAIGSGFHFDGVNDRVSIPDAPELRPASMTIEGWVRYNTIGSLRTFASRSVGLGTFNSFTVYTSAGTLRGFIGNASGQSSVAAIPSFALTSARWYHLAFTFDEATAMQTLYVDGTNAASAMSDRSIGYDTNGIILGAEFNSGVYDQIFGGALDEVAFYNRALSAAEIAAIHARDLAGKAFFGPYFTTVPELPFARLGHSYAQQLVTSRGTPPVTNEIFSGALPPGLSLSAAGWITGTPTNTGTFTFTARATDSNGLSGEQLFSLTVLPADPRPANLVAWWRAENDALDAVGTNHGTLVNGMTHFAGVAGRAFRLDGTNDYLRVVDAPALRPSSLTVEGWVRYFDTDGLLTFASKTAGAGAGRSFTIYSLDGVVRGYVGNATASSSVIASNTFALEPNRWYHLAFTYDGNTAMQRLYVDGTNSSSAVANQALGYTTNALLLGAEFNVGAYRWFFRGAQDEVAFYNRALTVTEIASIYSAGAAGKNVPPIANADTFTNVATLLLKIPKAGLLTNDTDADGDTLTFTSLPLVTTNGVTMITNSTFLFYTNGASVADQFSYVISDGFGGSATGTVSIVVLTNVTGQITGQLTVSNNVATAFFAGRPGWSYGVQRSTDLQHWTTVWTTNAPGGGLFQFTDDFNDLNFNPPPAAYYRLRWAP